jgi:hypothetical protein
MLSGEMFGKTGTCDNWRASNLPNVPVAVENNWKYNVNHMLSIVGCIWQSKPKS